MLIEYFETDLNLQLIFGLMLGLLFGVAAQISRFCLRRSVAAEDGPDFAGLAVWLTALGVAIFAVQIANTMGFVALEGHRYLAQDIPVLAILAGGLMFGVGMVLTRGCVTRLTVLSATGNLRAVVVLMVFAITAHAMLKGVLSPLRVALGQAAFDVATPSLAVIPGAGFFISAVVLAVAIWLSRRFGAPAAHLSLSVLIGLLVALGWVGTSTLLMDDFDPTPVQSLAFTLPFAESLFWTLASTAVPAGFGVGLIGGVLVGAFLSAATRSELSLVSFADSRETLRYGAGGVLMGVGGVLAGGCTIGAGLSGVSTLSVAAILALLSIVAGAVIARQAFRERSMAGVVAQ